MSRSLCLVFTSILFFPSGLLAGSGPEREALLSATWLGQVGDEEGAKVAVSWKGDSPAWIEIFEDSDGDGQLGRGERVLLERPVEQGMEVVPVAAAGSGALALRWRGDGLEGVTASRPAEPKGFAAACGTFPGAQLPVQSGPRSVAIGDLDGDGDADLAVANFYSATVSILLASGGGRFAAAVHYGVGPGPQSVAIGDLDGDGDLDLAVASFYSNVSILLGNGTGTFAAAVNYGVGSGPWSVAIGDLDSDGDLDLAVANRNSATVSILLGSGTGAFAAAVNYGVGSSPFSVAIGDLDGDGDLDLAVANQSSLTVSILLGSGTGAFAAAVNYGVGSSPTSVAIGDFDGDGDSDLAVANSGSNSVSILLGSGSGTFAAAVNYGVGSGPYSVAIGDLDGDGDSDLAVANSSSNSVSILLGSGSATFAAAVNYSVGSGPQSVAIGDLDGDGDLDLAVANTSSTVSILPGSGAGTFADAPVNYGVGTNPSSVAIGDLSGDGDADLAVANISSNNVSILLGSGTGTFADAVNYGVGTNPSSVAIGDLDGDGDIDLAVTNVNSSNVSILLGSGTGAFAAAVNYGVGSGPYSVAIGDLDGDGDLDLAVANGGSNSVSILLGSGTGTFAVAMDYAVGTSPSSVAIGDLDGDGDLDLGVANQGSNNVSILLGGGIGTFAAAVNYGVGSSPYSVATGDLDGDGDLDLGVANYYSNTISILLGSGTGTFAAAVNYGVGTNPSPVAIGDLDGDGNLDLAAANRGSHDVSVLLGSGAGTFAAAVVYPVGWNPSSVAIGDLDSDGDADLAVANSFSNNVSILSNLCSPPADTTAPTDPTIDSTSPVASTWSNDPTVEVTWSGAADEPGGSGLDRYRVLFDNQPATVPDDTTTVVHTNDPHMATSSSLTDGNGWYFHLSTCDAADNCTSTTAHAGPFWIDTTAPSAPGTVSSSSHSTTPVADTTIDISWVAATDVLSGVAYHRYTFTNSATPAACATFPETSFTTAATSAALADGSWYAHVCAVDNAGNPGAVSTGGPYAIDTAAPTGLLLSSSSHTASTWSSDGTVDVSLSGATDANGVTGYAIAFDQNAMTDPGTTPTQAGTSYVGTASSDGNSWYAHARACDQAGNCGSVVHLGPFWIDTTSPTAPGAVSSSSHDGGASNDTTIDVAWGASSDSSSGVASYRYAFTNSATPGTCASLGSTTASTSATSAALAAGTWYVHVCARDGVGLDSSVTTGGPYTIDLSAPSVTEIDSVATSGGEITEAEVVNVAITQLLVSFDEVMDETVAETLGNYLLVSSGTNETLDTTGCAVGGDDAAVAIDTAVYATQTTTLGINGGTPLGDELYALVVCSTVEDLAGNTMAAHFVRTFRVDLTSPKVTAVDSTADTGDGSLDPGEATNVSITDLHLTFDEALSDPPGDGTAGDVSNPASYRLVSAGVDGTLETADCSAVAGTDTAVGIDSATWDGPSTTVSLQIDGGALAEGLYRLFACASLTDLGGSALDGNGDDTGGDDFSRTFRVDQTDPSDPSTVESTSHTSGGWSSATTIAMSWMGASDDAAGLDRYRVLFDQLTNTVPDDTTTVAHATDPHGTSGGPLAEGLWYFHLSTCDTAGNCTSTVHRGPYGIDTTAPSAPGTVSSSSHSATPVMDTTIDVSWIAATDGLSGVASYRCAFTTSATPGSCASLGSTTGSTSASSTALADGSWYAHVCAVDNAGNMGAVSSGGPYAIDTAAPTGLLLSSSSHTASTWSSDGTIDVTLSGASDANGVTGYAIAFDQNAMTDPGTTPTQAGTSYVGTATSDGNSWYAHARACDQAGNCGAVVHLGPFWIDTTAPSTPTGVDSGSHTVGTPSSDATIDTDWDASSDATSGIDGYAWTFLGADSWSCDGVVDGTGLSTTSPSLSTGEFWLHVCSVDEAGNHSAVTSIGPFELDLVGPARTTIDTVADTGDGELEEAEVTQSSITQLLVSFDQELAQAAAEDLTNWVLVEAGADGTIETGSCTVAPSDVEVAPTSASLLGDQQSVRLDVGAGLALPAGSYRLWACSGITDELGNEAAPASLNFEVTATNLVTNPNFDDGIVPWTAGGTRPGDLGWQGVDAEGKPTSGSLEVATTSGVGATTTAEACLVIESGIPFVLGGAVEVTGGSGGDPVVTIDLVGSTNPSCQASGDTGGAVGIAAGPTAGWVPFSAARPGSWGSVLVRFSVVGGTSSTHSARIDLLRLDGPLFADGFESGDTSAWSAAAP